MSITTRIRNWAATVKRDIVALYLAGRDPRVPWYAKALAIAAAAYAFSPIDLIPDFIPIIGYLDDLLLLPGMIALAIALIPDEVMQEMRQEAAVREIERPHSHGATLFVVLLWLAGAALLFLWLA